VTPRVEWEPHGRYAFARLDLDGGEFVAEARVMPEWRALDAQREWTYEARVDGPVRLRAQGRGFSSAEAAQAEADAVLAGLVETAQRVRRR
jgi:hypothetical protein